ncbi:MAG: hypothetical protein EXR72_14045 [Myxococcales bacterium]|nr:hypothetical protein [Myxococcales bacterium]
MAGDAILDLGRLRAVDLERSENRFTDGKFLYGTSGKRVGSGGMGNVWTLARWPVSHPNGAPEMVVGKTFREEFLILLREDETARRRFDHFEQVIEAITTVEHPNVLPVLLVSPILDNYLMVSPLAGQSLLALLTRQGLSPRDRVKLLTAGMRGLAALHARGIVHRDFTLHNILTVGNNAAVFDFDLSVSPAMLPEEEKTYRGYYQGRIAGSPEFSVAPELLDEVLGYEPISPRADVYAAGTALFALFTDDSLYGDVPDLSTLLYRIADGVVHRGVSRIKFPDDVPAELRPIIQRCLEREPNKRYADAREVCAALDAMEADLSDREARAHLRRSIGFEFTQVTLNPEVVFAARADLSVTRDEMAQMERLLARQGYLLEKCLGRVKDHPIFLALPDPALVATGSFPEENTYRKIVTAIDVAHRLSPGRFVDNWLGRIYPILRRVRLGFLTPLYKVVHEKEAGQLLLFSEYIADPRFGADLEKHKLSLEEAFGLGLIGALSIARLHSNGLAHNNLRPPSLVFKGQRDAGRVTPLFLGLVEPSFDPLAMEEDVRNLALMIGTWIRPSRIDALRPEVRPMLAQVSDRLARTASGELREPAPTIHELIDVLSDALSAIEPNFEILRHNGGDLASFADLLCRHSLYHKLYALDVNDE